jgi:hypothetical protein
MLSLDMYKASEILKLKERAYDLNIEHVFGPAEGTSLYEPFAAGPLENSCRGESMPCSS